jgi:hypothetical protein
VQADPPAEYVPLFRPPYWQRRADGERSASQQLRVSLWDTTFWTMSTERRGLCAGADPDAAVAQGRDPAP